MLPLKGVLLLKAEKTSLQFGIWTATWDTRQERKIGILTPLLLTEAKQIYLAVSLWRGMMESKMGGTECKRSPIITKCTFNITFSILTN